MSLLRSLMLVAFALVSSTLSRAQTPALEYQLPEWAQRKWQSLSKARSLKLSDRINPFVWRGDFDGDGNYDLAVLVQHVPSGKQGIVILVRGDTPAIVLGAGRAFGNGGDDFTWMDLWAVADRGSSHKAFADKPVRLRVDALIVAKDGSASALIYLDKGRPKWQQQGD